MKNINSNTFKEFIEDNNFPDKEWKARGLIPSSEEKVTALNELIKEIALALSETADKKDIPRILQGKLENLSLDRFDTEEKEFLIDRLILLFDKAGHRRIIYKWLDVETKPLVNDYSQLKVTRQRCLRCQSKLINWIIEQDPQHDYPDWEIAKCNECGKLNLINIDNVKSFQPKNFDIIKSLNKSRYSKEAALAKIEKLEGKK